MRFEGKMKLTKHILISISILLFVVSCANMAQGPSGGKKDVTPPSYVGSLPANNSKNVTSKKIEIEFNEYLQINNPSQNLVVSPPQKPAAVAKVIGKKVVVEIKDSLKENTTYTFDFGNCIGDYTENNPVKDFCYSFSTGNEIDSMVISGVVLNAQNLVPVEGAFVGIYSDNEDSSFTHRPFERISKTDKNGRFAIKGSKAKQYYIYALSDLNSNYYYDQVGEGFAVQEAPLPIPSVTTTITYDTTYKDSAVIDTIIAHSTLRYLPDSVILRMSTKYVKIQEFDKIERSDRKSIKLFMKKEEASVPKIELIDSFYNPTNWYLIEKSQMADTVKYWITDTTVLKMDSIRLAVTYLKTDSAENFVEQTDTLYANLSTNYLKEEEKKEKQEELMQKRYEKRGMERARQNILEMTDKARRLEIEASARFEWEYPISTFKPEMTRLYTLKDSDTTYLAHQWEILENNRTLLLKADILPGERYTVVFDSASVFDYYGNHNNTEEATFSKKDENEYGSIALTLKNAPANSIVQLLNSKDMAEREERLTSNKITFKHLPPSTYFVKIISDRNQNGKWDAGIYEDKILPEEVYYFPKSLKLRANWDMEEEWNVTELKIDQQRSPDLHSESAKKKK